MCRVFLLTSLHALALFLFSSPAANIRADGCPCTGKETCICADKCNCPNCVAVKPTVTVYCYQANPGPVHSHSWAVFRQGAKAVTISWMPETIPHWVRAAQRGKNWTHETTLRYAAQVGAKVKRWGPYPCRAEVAAKAFAWVKRLESGEVLYAAVDAVHPHGTNCVSAVACPGGSFPRTFLYGFRAGPVLVKHLTERP